MGVFDWQVAGVIIGITSTVITAATLYIRLWLGKLKAEIDNKALQNQTIEIKNEINLKSHIDSVRIQLEKKFEVAVDKLDIRIRNLEIKKS